MYWPNNISAVVSEEYAQINEKNLHDSSFGWDTDVDECTETFQGPCILAVSSQVDAFRNMSNIFIVNHPIDSHDITH